MLRLLAVTLVVLALNGCTTIVDAVTQKPIRPDPAETSLGTDIDDWQMETFIGVNIKKAHPALDKAHINVNAYNGVILLTGETSTANLRSLAGTTARNFRGVRQVHNELQVGAPSSLLSRSHDRWLTAKIKSKLIAYKDIESSKVKVVVENDAVYLMGIVTQDQAKKVTNVARNTRGVKKVVKAFEYLD